MKKFCEVCGKELKGYFIWIQCSYFEYHPLDECGGCEYPVGLSCARKIPKEFHSRSDTARSWHEYLKVKK